jgi:hypothetical protein
MHPIGLLRVAAEAEGLRLRHQASRSVTRVVAGVIGLGFLVVAAGFAHMAIWYWLTMDLAWVEYRAAGVVAAGDLVLALICVLIAARSRPGRVEAEALEIRRKALGSAGNSLATATVLVPLVRTAIGIVRGTKD